jgi:hypothetical protein
MICAPLPIICYDPAMSRKPGIKKPQSGAADADFDGKLALAGEIMSEDREVLRALAGGQIAAARKVMVRRKRALRELAE